MARLKPEDWRFYDGGSLDGSEPPDRSSKPPEILLLRDVTARVSRRTGRTGRPRETFILQRRIAYDARWQDGPDLQIVVPAPTVKNPPADKVFRSDLTSVPDLFTWLVPRTGCHLPAALIHDGLIYDPGEPASYWADAPVPRIEADRIFRDAMGDLGTGLARRWLMWSAVTLATVAAGVTDVAPPGRTVHESQMAPRKSREDARLDLRYQIAVFGLLLLIGLLGAVATLDLFDVWNVLPWMGEHRTIHELALGAVAALGTPVVLSLLWGRLRVAGMIAGWALALLLHVTVVLGILTAAFQGLEWFLRNGPRIARRISRGILRRLPRRAARPGAA